MATIQDHRVNLLSLDGGGIRGLSSLLILKHLMQKVGGGGETPKPCHFFRMMGGTSTGGLIAIMLGRLQMTVDECIDKYIVLSDKVFKKQHNLPFSLPFGQVQARCDTKALEREIKQIIVDAGFSEDELMRNEDPDQCKTFVCATMEENAKLIKFTSYKPSRGEDELYQNAKIWEVARATSAATTFFDPITICQQNFVDGGLGVNNPVNHVLREAAFAWPGNPYLQPLSSRIKCLLSIGTGDPSLTAVGNNFATVIKTLKNIATETVETANNFPRDQPTLEGKYFRFSVTKGLEDVGLSESKQVGKIKANTIYHLDTVDYVQARVRAFLIAVQENRILQNLSDTISTANLSQMSLKAQNPLPVSGFAFYTLDKKPRFIQMPPVLSSYWGYLTVDSLTVYKQVYRACRRPDGKVELLSFAQQIPNQYGEDAIRFFWSLLASPEALLSRNLTMALLYMLHIRTALGMGLPKPIVDARRKALECFGNWVECACVNSCGRKWNFANSTGLQRNVDNSRICLAKQWVTATPEKQKEDKAGKDYYGITHLRWQRGRQPSSKH